jgi:tripartite-type tricarboxylate transporter receptor subunit TctC
MATRLLLLPAAAALALAAATAGASADEVYPSRMVRIVVPYPAGTIPDTLGRMVADRLQGAFGQPVVVENRAGGSTLLGAKVVASAPGDGYTLLIPTITTLSLAPQLNPRSGVDPLRDFTPIARLGASNFFLVVRSSFPATTMQEWIDEVRKHPGTYSYASAGNGTPHHIFMELLKKQLGLVIAHVPYKGSILAVPDLLAERVDMSFLDGEMAYAHVMSGKLRALGTSMAKRTVLISGVPPIADTVANFDWSGWIGVAGPRDMPYPVVARIADEIAQLRSAPAFAEFLNRSIMEPMPAQSPAQMADFVRAEFVRWGPVIRASGAAIE